jgi:hypothetical protein
VTTLLDTAAFVLCVVALATGPLTAPTRPVRRHNGPAWAQGPLTARRYAHARTRTHNTEQTPRS